MHWAKNVIEKQIRKNMGCSTTIMTGVPTSSLSRPINTLEHEWGKLAMRHLSESDFKKSGLTNALVRFFCLERGIFEAGLSIPRLLDDLNKWRKNAHILTPDGLPTEPDNIHMVKTAKAHYYLSRAMKNKSNTLLSNNSDFQALFNICMKLGIPLEGTEEKPQLEKKLLKAFKDVLVPNVKESETQCHDEVAVLGKEVVEDIKLDMRQTQLPTFLKTPPINFATVDHGKIGAEEYKSLAIVSLPITLIQLWGHTGIDSAYQERLDHFLHLSVAIRILSYQTITAHDINLFEYHYTQYLLGLKKLYPFCSVVPVQHLGMHIPYFLRALGPSSRYSENTPEMLIGMLEDISTNHKIGELEQTLHREVIMAANLKSSLRNTPLPAELASFSGAIEKFLGDRYPSNTPVSSTWHVSHSDDPIILDPDTYTALTNWCRQNQKKKFSRHLYLCSKIWCGNLVYQPYENSSANAFIAFRQ
ncbi:hypothetical protein FRC11_008699 [Ceratobasidium sp. 423]|nr:hypothetical protein FRC11_008699 [Ceratobasidium sp. 423]